MRLITGGHTRGAAWYFVSSSGLDPAGALKRGDRATLKVALIDFDENRRWSLAEEQTLLPALALALALASPAAIPSVSCAWSTPRSARSRPSCGAGWPRASVRPTSWVSPTT